MKKTFKILAAYTFEKPKKNGGYIRQLKPGSGGKYVIDKSNFVDTDKSFADAFPNMEWGKLYYVDDEAYFIGGSQGRYDLNRDID